MLLHLTSLPDAPDLGPAASAFADFLADAACTIWQMLPVGPTHPEDGSPYNAVSAIAGDPELVSLAVLEAEGLLTPGASASSRAVRRTDAARRFLDGGDLDRFEQWRGRNADWLEDYVQFVALRESLGDQPWVTWPEPLRDRETVAVRTALEPLADRLAVLRVEQWFFAEQWAQLKQHAVRRGVLLFGDLPIFVSHDSADVWAHRDLFLLDDDGQPTTVTGVPPDYFAAEGQRWNNPHYDWSAMERDGFAWWRRRVAVQRERFDLVRIDHFRGFEAAWHVPMDAATAKDGWWVRSPGPEILAALIETAGRGTLVAEELGTIPPEVQALRRDFGLPGMKVLQFAFDGDPDNLYLPKNHGPDDVVYTGTHDNDTTLGWWRGLGADWRRLVGERIAAVSSAGELEDASVVWTLIQIALESPARLAVVPAQDLLGLGSEARMNTPGTDTGNWTWQARSGAFDAELAARLRAQVEAAGRAQN